jgi:hypothetical protein
MALTGGKLGLEAWRLWAQYGLALFPCAATKAPLTKRGFKDGRTDKNEVVKLFARCGAKAEYVGAALGPVDENLGYFVLDFDLYKQEGKAEHDRLVRDGVVSDNTLIHRTVNGGLHYFYAYNPNKIEVGCPKPAEGVEVKGAGGYVIVPPSKGYEVASGAAEPSIKMAPPAVLAYIRDARRSAKTASTESYISRIVEAKEFHDSAVVIAARQQSRGYTRSQTMKMLLEAFEASVARSKEHPRHERWLHIMQDDGRELSRIVNSAYMKYSTDAASASMKDARPTTQGSENEGSDDEDFENPFPRSYLAGHADNDEDRQFILHPLIMSGDVVLLSADPKAGKTLFAVGASLSMACGIPFGGLTPVGDDGEARALPVLYFALEGQGALRQRIAAWMKYTEENYDLDRDRIPMTVVEQHYDFTNPAHRADILDRVVRLQHKVVQDYECPLQLLVIDTLTKAMPGKDQNSVEDTSAVFSFTNELRQAGIEAAVMFIHHNNRSGGVRGSSNILAEPDTVLTLTKEDREVDGSIESVAELKVHMARSVDDTLSQLYMFRGIDLGVNRQGIKMRAPVFTPVVSTSETRSVEEHYMKQHRSQKKVAFYTWLLENVTAGVSYSIEALSDMIAAAPANVRHYYTGYRIGSKKAQVKTWQKIAADNTEQGLTISVDPETASVMLHLHFEKAS